MLTGLLAWGLSIEPVQGLNSINLRGRKWSLCFRLQLLQANGSRPVVSDSLRLCAGTACEPLADRTELELTVSFLASGLGETVP